MAVYTWNFEPELIDGALFVKRFGWEPGAAYPDGGCNAEVFTAGGYMELESLGPLTTLEPGASVEHVERWSLVGGLDGTDEALERAIHE